MMLWWLELPLQELLLRELVKLSRYSSFLFAQKELYVLLFF